MTEPVVTEPVVTDLAAEESAEEVVATTEQKVDALLASKMSGGLWPAPGFDVNCIPLPEEDA